MRTPRSPQKRSKDIRTRTLFSAVLVALLGIVVGVAGLLGPLRGTTVTSAQMQALATGSVAYQVPVAHDLTQARKASVSEDGTYTSKKQVAAYIHRYGHLPSNFITKKEARAAGWVASEGNLDEVCPGKSIGGDRFYNYEGSLPTTRGVTYYECDIDYTGGRRSSKRIVYGTDDTVYYTDNHYQTFTQLY